MINGNREELEKQALKSSTKSKLEELYSEKENIEQKIINDKSDLKVVCNLIDVLENNPQSKDSVIEENNLFPEEPQTKSNREIIIGLFNQNKKGGLTALELSDLFNENNKNGITKGCIKYYIKSLLADRVIKQKNPKQKRNRKYKPV